MAKHRLTWTTRSSEDRALVPLLDLFSNALGAAAFLFMVFPAMSLDDLRSSLAVDPSSRALQGQESVWLLVGTFGGECPKPNSAPPVGLKAPDRLLRADTQRVVVLLHGAEETPTFTIEPGCKISSFILYTASGQRESRQNDSEPPKYEIKVRQFRPVGSARAEEGGAP